MHTWIPAISETLVESVKRHRDEIAECLSFELDQ
jgi:hypothetical protein